jgi:Ca2+-binding EF-hand superfamily protein
MEKPGAKRKMELIKLPAEDMHELFFLLDTDSSGTISVDEFLEGIKHIKVRGTLNDT